MVSGDGGRDASPAGAVSGDRATGRAAAVNPPLGAAAPSPPAAPGPPPPPPGQNPPANPIEAAQRGQTYGRPRRQAQNEQGRRPQNGPLEQNRQRQIEDGNAWFPLTYAEMYRTLQNGQSARRVALVPLRVIEDIRNVIRDPNSTIPKQQKELTDLFNGLERKLGKDRSSPWQEAKRIGWRVAVMAGATVFWLANLAGTLAMLAGGIGAATWVITHKQFFKKWRDLDDTRVLEAVKERRRGLRSPFQKPIKERLARVGAYTLLAAFSPVAFVSELAAQCGRNAQLRILKRRVEKKRDKLDARMDQERVRIEAMASNNRKSPILELPENVLPSPAAYDAHYHAANTPASNVQAPGPGPAAQPQPQAVPVGASALSDEFDLRRRRGAGVTLP
jgi:hypothetical protein